MMTWLTGALTLFGAVWCGLCVYEASSLPGEACLTVTAALLTAALLIAVTCLFLPDVPRLRREKGRSKEKGAAAAGLILLLAGGALLAWEAAAFTAGRSLLMETPRTAALCVSVLALMGCILAYAAWQMTLCWNDEGLVIRTFFGRVHRFTWGELTARDYHRGTPILHAGSRHYVLPGSSKASRGFWACADERRKALGLPPVPHRKSWLERRFE